jgi:hypothetical protein
VDIAKLNPDEISGSDLTGGYILSIDRQENFWWISPYRGVSGYGNIVINYIYPEYAEMPNEQRNYIRNYVTSFENALNSENFRDPENGYRLYADPASFVDFFLISEMTRNVDAYRLSTYFYKDKEGKLTMGPIWDFNLAFGNADYYFAYDTQGWMMHTVEIWDQFQVPFWWERLRQDDYFNNQLKNRWRELRQGPFKTSNILHYVDSVSIRLLNARQRNFERFPIFRIYIWPNYYVGLNYDQELDYFKTWIAKRILWMDQQLDLIGTSENNPLANTYETYAFPNPFRDQVTIRLRLYHSAEVSVSIFDITGRLIVSLEKSCMPGLNDFVVSEERFRNQSGIYIYEIKLNGVKFTSGKIVQCQ